MAKNVKFYLFFLSTLLLVQSCSMGKYVKSDITGQAKIPIPSHIKSVNILDKASTKKPVDRVIKVVQGKSFNDDEYVSARGILVRKIKPTMPVSAKVLMKTKRVADADELLDLHRIKKFGEGADGLFCLEQFNYQPVITEEKEFKKHQLDKNGKDYYIDAFRKACNISLNTLWRLYDTKTGEVLLTIPQKIEDKLEAEGLNQESVDKKMDSLYLKNAEKLATELGQQLAKDLRPKYRSTHWKYYKKGHHVIKKSAKFIKKGQFRPAIQSLESALSNLNQPELKEKAMYNIAVSYCLLNDDTNAILWARKGYNISKNENLRLLIGQLKVN